MNKFMCTAVLAAGMAFFGTGTEEAHAGNNSFFLSVGGPRASFTYSSGYRGGFGGYRGYGWNGYPGRRVPLDYGRPLFRPSYYDVRPDYHRRRPCDRGYYGY